MENNSAYLNWINFCKNFKFHPRLEPSIRSLKKESTFYKEMIKNWEKYLSCFPNLPSATLSQLLWLNWNTKIDNKSICFSGIVKYLRYLILSIRFFRAIARLNHEIILNQNTTFKVN